MGKDQFVKEGESAKFILNISKPHDNVQWFKEDREIRRYDARYKAFSDGNQLILSILDAELSDEAQFSCNVGDKVSRARLHVEENEAEFSRPLKDVTVTEGESATFRCDVNKIPKDATITWYLNDRLVSNDRRITTTVEGKRLVMTVNDTTLDDEGRVKVQVGKSVSEAKLRIEELPPVIVKGLDEFVTGLEEKEVTLEATVDKDHRKKSGEPIEGEWSTTKKGAAPRVLRPSYKYHMSQNENVYALTIKDLMFEDEGVYTFKFEGQETHCKLKVDEAPVVLTKPLSRIGAKEKDDVTLECEANKVKWKLSGKDIDFTWKKGDARLDETPKTKFEKQGRKLMLVMKKITLNDASDYSCNAGEGPLASKTIGGIEVQERPLGFEEGLKDLEKTEGETAVLEAVINRPGADVLWFKDGKKIDFSDPRFEQKQDKDGRIQLIIKPCVMDDEATYEAKVGTKKTSCKFRVKEGPAIFIHPLSDMSVKEGAPAILHAEVNKLRYQQSGASVTITWYRND